MAKTAATPEEKPLPPLESARELLQQALASTLFDAEALASLRIVDKYLIKAIETENLPAFRVALAQKADVNAAGGKPLIAAATVNNQLMMKELMLHGADISHAQNEMKKEREAIPRKKRYDHWGDVSYTYKKGDRKRYSDLGTHIKRLGDYQKTFIKDIAPIESVQIQFRTLQEIQEMKAEMLTALHGKPLPKPQMPAPAAFTKPPKPEGM